MSEAYGIWMCAGDTVVGAEIEGGVVRPLGRADCPSDLLDHLLDRSKSALDGGRVDGVRDVGSGFGIPDASS